MDTLASQLLKWGSSINTIFSAVITIVAVVAGAILVIKAILELKNGSKNAKQAALYLACGIGCFAVAGLFGVGGGALSRIGGTLAGSGKSFLEDSSKTELSLASTIIGGFGAFGF